VVEERMSTINMSLALADDMNGMWPQLPLMECTFPPLLFLHRHPFSCLTRTWWDGVKEDVQTGRVEGRADPGST